MKTVIVIAATLLSLTFQVRGASAQTINPSSANVSNDVVVSDAVHHDLSLPLTQLHGAPTPPGPHVSDSVLHVPLPAPVPGTSTIPIQTSASIRLMPATSLNIDGVGNGFSGPQGTFSVNSAPPDTVGAVGPNHYVQVVNTDFAVFNKNGTVLYGPVATNTLFSGFGGGCQTNNDGDGVVEYDSIANRWVISQFSVNTTPYLQCVAISQTPDPTGAYYRYSFSYGNSNFNDYPKFGVWPDAYYVTFNMFAGGTTFNGAEACAYDRAKMLIGQAATQQCFSTSTAYGGLLPSSVEGSRQPPAGSPNYLVALGATTTDLATWKFHVDWSNSANTTFTGPTSLTVGNYSPACGGGTCIPQSGTSQQLDSLADRIMYRLQYRNFGDHEALVVNHSVTVGSSTGIRWYELRPDASHNLSVFQQGTYAPDANFRWMGSIAMDQQGNMGLGFSVSSGSTHPAIHYAGRLAGDAVGTLGQGEGTIFTGAGSQSSGLSRWGDYSAMSVDPVDDCTFWYTTEYIPSNGSFNWKTRIATFKFPGCGSTPPPNDFSISASPSSLSVMQGSSGTSTISTAVTSGSAQSVALSASGLPSGTTASFNPTSVTAGGSSTLTITAGASTTPGTYSVTVTGTGTSATHTTTVSLTVTAPVTNDFSIGASPASVSVTRGSSGTSTINTAVTSGSAQSVTLSASGAPSGVTTSFNPTSVTAGNSSTLTISTSASAAAGTYSITVTGTGASATHATTVSLTITAPPPNDFSISASPTSVTVTQGSSGTSTISTAITSGSAQSVSLSASGLPSGASASFNPASVTAGGSSTLTITTTAATPTGTSTVTVTGTGASATHAATISLTVSAAGSGGITNGGFESGGLAGWSSTGSTSVSTTGHSGTHSAMVGSTSPTNGDSSISQTFTVPGGSGTLSFWYQIHCPDTLTYDWATATLKDNTSNTSTTVLQKTCSNSSTWVQVTASVTAGHSYTLTLVSHDDNYVGDPTYTLYDDVALSGVTPPPPSGITNGGFETGNLSGWTASGSTAVSTVSHTGTYAALLGSTSPTNGDSTISQTFAAGSGNSHVSFWYANTCPDTLTYDWATATLKDNTAGTTTTILAKTCTTSGPWTQVTASVVAGHSYTLTLINHDDNYPSDPTYTRFDDVVLS